MPADQSGNVLAKIGKYVRSRSRSPGGNSRSGGYGSPLGILALEASLIDTDQKVPKLFNTLIRHLRPHLGTEGLFRVSPSARTLHTLKTKVEVDRLEGVDPHSLAFLLKAWLRELPQGLVPPPFQDRLLASSAIEDIKTAVIALPDLNKATLNALFEFLSCVAADPANKMDAGALAIVLGPSLFRVQATSEGLQATNKTNEIAHKFIKQYTTFREAFSSGKQNAEVMSLASREELTQLNEPSSPKELPSSPKSDNSNKLRQAINDSVNQYLSLSGEEDVESASDPSSPMVKHDSNTSSDRGPEPTPLTPGLLTPSPQPHERLNPPTRSAPKRGSRRRPSRNRSAQQLNSINTPQLKQRSAESVNSSSNTTSNTASNEPLDVFERLNDGPSLEGWRTEHTPGNSAAPTPSATPLIQPDFNIESESNPASPMENPAPPPPKLDLSSLTPAPDSPLPKSKESPRPLPKFNSESESQPEGDLTVVNTPRTSPDCDEVKQRRHRLSESSEAAKPRPRTKERKSKTLGHKKQNSTESEIGPDKKTRGRSRNRAQNGPFDDHLTKLKNAVRELEDRMSDRRDVAGRLQSIEGMSELQLREEKAELQRELLIFESNYGRPTGGPDRQAVRLIYHRYRELKRRLSRLDNRSAPDQEAFLREIESELSRIERERRELGRTIKSWEAAFRLDHGRSPGPEEKTANPDYSRYKHLRSRRTFLQDLQQQKAPESFTV